MKKLLAILFVFISVTCFSQNLQTRATNNVTVIDANLFTGRSFRVPQFSDTTAANLVPTLDSSGKLIYTFNTNSLWFRQNAPKRWTPIASTNGNNGSDTLFAQLPAFFDSLTRAPSTILKILHSNGLFSGGVVTLDTCMKADVTPAVYFLNYNQYTTAQVLGLVIQPADVFDRTDAVIADSFGIVSVLRGLTGNVAPYVDPSSQVLLATIPVPANATCLSIVQEIIYDGITDNPADWTHATTGTITAAFVNTDNRFHLAQDLFISVYGDGATITWTKPSGYDTVKASEILKIPMYFNGVFSNQIRVQFLKDGVPVSNSLVINPYFNANDSNQYQIPSIPLSAWSFPGGGVFNGIVISFAGNDLSGAKGLYFDYIQLQTGIVNVSTGLQLTTNFTSGASTLIDNVLNIPIYSGGGGGGNTIYTADDQIISDRTVDLNGHSLTFAQNSGGLFFNSNGDAAFGGTPDDFFNVKNVAGSDLITIDTIDKFSNMVATDGIASASISLVGNSSIPYVIFDVSATNGSDNVQITGDATAKTVSISADTILLNSTLSGASTGYVWTLADPTTGSGYWGASGGGGGVTADNGLTVNTGSNVQLGGTLTKATTIETGAFTLTINTSTSSVNPLLVTALSDYAIIGTSLDAVGVNGNSNTLYGLYGTSGTNTAIYAVSTDFGLAAEFDGQTTGTSDVQNILALKRRTTNTAANGIGGAIEFLVEQDNGVNSQLSNQIISKWTDAATATRTSELSITGVNSAATQTLLTLSGNGEVIINNGALRIKGYTVATLPAGTVGDIVYVTDALTPAYHITVVGGGAVIIPVFYNGTNWIVD